MGFMDKVKGLGEAGKEKLDTVQAKRRADSLFEALGAAYYSNRMGRADKTQQIEEIVGQLQAHEAEHGEIGGDPAAAAPQQAPAYAQQPMGGMPQSAPMGGGMPQAAADPMAAAAPPAAQPWGGEVAAPAGGGFPQSAPDPMAPPAAPMGGGFPQSAPDPMAPPAAPPGGGFPHSAPDPMAQPAAAEEPGEAASGV
jgi:hypothetical protein